MTKREKPTCGVVMPISGFGEYSGKHWSDVLDILTDAIDSAGFEANMVSDADDIGVIHRRIIQNLYDLPIVVCDISGKNANVMFELGLRLAFDNPTIIVKDNSTAYSFDTSPIEHLTYPTDLRYADIVKFKSNLSEKIRNTHKKSIEDPEYSTFLGHFGEFKVVEIAKTEVSGQEYVIEEVRQLRRAMERFVRQPYSDVYSRRGGRRPNQVQSITLGGLKEEDMRIASYLARDFPGVTGVTDSKIGSEYALTITADEETDLSFLRGTIFDTLSNLDSRKKILTD